MKVVVINLDKSRDRMKNISDNLNNLNIPFQRFSAIYGKDLTDTQIKENTTQLCRNFLCNFGIIGCAMSHTTIWKEFKNSEDDYICVMEDDAIINEKFPKLLLDIDIIYQQTNFDFLSLFCIGMCSFSKDVNVNEYTLSKSLFPLSAVCYILSKKGVKRLLTFIDKINYNIDYMIAYQNFFKGFDYYYLKSPNTITTNLDESNIVDLCPKGLLNKTLSKLKSDKLKWVLNLPAFTINLRKSITVYMILLLFLILFCMRKKYYFLMIIFTVEFILVF